VEVTDHVSEWERASAAGSRLRDRFEPAGANNWEIMSKRNERLAPVHPGDVLREDL